MSFIFHSIADSELFGLKTGHTNATRENVNSILAEAVHEKYDLCRIKVPNADVALLNAIAQSGIPGHHAYNIVKYYPMPPLFPKNMPLTPGATFTEYDGSNPEELIELVEQAFADDPIGYYHTPELNALIGKEKEAYCLALFLSRNFITTKNRRLWVLHMNGKPVGFIANKLDFTASVCEAMHAGILPEYRNNGLFASIIRFNINFLQDVGINKIDTGSRAYAKAAIRVFEGEGIPIEGTDAIVHLMPMLTVNK